MQSYGQHPAGYQRPGSTTGFTAPPVPPPYGAPQGYQTTVSQTQNQWTPPTQTQTPAQQQWSQPQQAAGGYNPGVYGAMPGGYSQAQQTPVQSSTAYQQQDVPPPPPPKPASFAATTHQQNAHQWGSQAGHAAHQPQQNSQNSQQNTSYAVHAQQAGYGQQSGHQGHGAPQQSYSNAAPPPPSQTPGGPYFPPSQTTQAASRPGSIYGADQTGLYSSPSSAVAQQPPNTVPTPNEHNPAVLPPSLTGQGVQSYLPSNTNPIPGVYVPRPPETVPAWQQASHAPLQGGKKFKYTKPAPYGQSYPGAQAQGPYGQQPSHPPQQYGQTQHPPTTGQVQQQGQYGQSQPQAQYSQGIQSQLPQYGPTIQQTPHPDQAAPSYHQPSYTQQGQAQSYQQQPQNQWQSTSQAEQGYAQQIWQPGYQAQGLASGQQYPQGHEPGIQAPKPVTGHTGTTPLGFVSEQSPQSQPVSPMQNRFNTNYGSSQASLGRTGSASSIALGAIHTQRADNRTESPKPQLPKLPTPPPPRDDATKFSVLGTGGPSDWEHFGGGEEIDDEELFGAKTKHAEEPAQLGSVELPAQQVSPPQPQGEWPTPIAQSTSASIPNRDTYQPTPSSNSGGMPTQRPPSQSPQQTFVVGDAPRQQTPKQTFMVDDATTALHQQPPQQSQQDFIVHDAVVAPLRISQPSSHRNTPAQHQAQHPPPPVANTAFSIDDGGWVQANNPQPVAQQADVTHTTELNMNDDALERLRVHAEQEKADLQADLRAEVEQLKAVIETTKNHAEYERNVLTEEIVSMKVTAEHSKTNADILNKEKDSTIERLKEDGEGKEDTIREKEVEISQLRDELKAKEDTITRSHVFIEDLKKQLEAKENEVRELQQRTEANESMETEMDNLKQELEAEKSKDLPKPEAAALISDIDPWYVGSLERYIAMLRSEAHATLVDDKIKAFTEFLRAESSVRGLEYHNAPPSAPPSSQQQTIEQSTIRSRNSSTASTRKNDLSVQVLSTDAAEDDIQYSPGGRPIVQRRPPLKSEDSSHPQQSFSVSSQSTAVLTPTSSQDDGFSKTPTPIQSPPAEPHAKPQYKAYIPPGISQAESMQNIHRQSISSPTAPTLDPAFSQGKRDEVFFSTSTSSPSTKPTAGGSSDPDVPVPAPLFTPQPPVSTPKSMVQSTESQCDELTKLLPTKVGMPQPNPQLQAIRDKLSVFPAGSSLSQDLTTAWEKSASLVRRKNDDARRKRQEESEEETDHLFNENEISYADIAVIEDEFKEKERKLKAEEDRAEYQSYVETVFDKVYDALQQEIKELMDLYIEAENLLATSVSGVKSLEGTEVATTEDCLKLLEDLFEEIEQRHEKVVEAVAKRDKRYKKTEVQPLYVVGNITKMKAVEKHFANAEKQASQRARDEKAERVNEFVRIVEAAVIAAVGVEQQEIQDIISAVRDLPSSTDKKLLMRARETVLALDDSSKALLLLLNDIEIDIGGSGLEAQLAEAKAEKQSEMVAQLENQIFERQKKLKEELKRKEAVLDQDREEIDKVVREKGGKVEEKTKPEVSEDGRQKARMSKALEEAKRRNGDL